MRTGGWLLSDNFTIAMDVGMGRQAQKREHTYGG